MTGAAKFFLSIVILSASLPVGLAQRALEPTAGTRSMVVNIFDARGNGVRDLTKENFRLRVNGKPATVLDARYSVAPRRMVVLLDMSGSMIGDNAQANGKWRMAREAADDLLTQTPGKVQIALLSFSEEVRDVFNFSQSRDVIAEWLRADPSQRPNRKYSPRTALFDAILEAAKLLQPTQPGDAIYAITDGGDDASLQLAGKARSTLLESGVRLFTLLFAEPVGPAADSGKVTFLAMVYDSGGLAFPVSRNEPAGSVFSWESFVYKDDHPEKLKLATQRLDSQIIGFWTLDIAIPSSNKASKVKLEVVGADGRIRKDLGVAYSRVLPGVR